MSGSVICRSTRSASAATRAVSSAASPKAQPLARAVDPLDPCARKLERRRGLLQVDDQGALCAVPFLQVGDLRESGFKLRVLFFAASNPPSFLPRVLNSNAQIQRLPQPLALS